MRIKKVMAFIFTITFLIISCSCGPNSFPYHKKYAYPYRYADYGKFVAILKYEGNEKEVSVPDELDGEPVTAIGENAFMDNTDITSVKIPDGVTFIQNGAFAGCSALSDFIIPDGVTFIDGFAFYGCTSLKDITIPAGVTSIGNDAFTNTPWLNGQKDEFVIVGDGVLIKYNGRDSVVEIPVGVKSISSAFKNCDFLTSIIFLDGLTEIGEYSFFGCNSLTDIHIPDGVTSIGECAFYNCTSLTNIEIPKSVKEMKIDIFFGCSDQLVISGKKGSVAQQYAKDEKITFSKV